MTAKTPPRRWTVEITVAGQDVTELLDLSTVPDTLREVESAAYKVAAQLIKDEYGSDASLIVYKRLAGFTEPRRDRSHYVYRDDDGRVKRQFMGA